MRRSGEARVAVGTLILTRRVTRPDEVLPDEYRYSQTAAIYQGDVVRFPRFDLHPANAATKLLETAGRAMLGLGNIGKVDFPSHPEFASRYRVQAFDAERTRWLFEDRLLTHLEGRSGLSISASNGTLLLYRTGAEIPREGLQAFANEAVEIFRLFEAAARRPGAFNDPMRPRPTDQELFAEQLAGTGLGLKKLPGVTLAEAEAFMQQPPPRTITTAIARYVEARTPFLVGAVGGAFAAGGAFFLLLGWQKWQWFELIPLFFFLVCGAGGAIWFVVARLRIRHLLRHGRTGTARIEAIQSGISRVDGESKFRLELQIDAGGAMHRASCPVPDKAIPRLQAIAAEKRPIPVLYSASNPARVLVADDLVMEQGIG